MCWTLARLQKTERACNAELAAITLYPRGTSGITALFNPQLREPLLNISAIFLEKDVCFWADNFENAALHVSSNFLIRQKAGLLSWYITYVRWTNDSGRNSITKRIVVSLVIAKESQNPTRTQKKKCEVVSALLAMKQM